MQKQSKGKNHKHTRSFLYKSKNKSGNKIAKSSKYN